MSKLENLMNEVDREKNSGSNVFLLEVTASFASKGDPYYVREDDHHFWMKDIEQTTVELAKDNEPEEVRAASKCLRVLDEGPKYLHSEDNVGFVVSAIGDWPAEPHGYTNGFDMDAEQIGHEVFSDEDKNILISIAERRRQNNAKHVTFVAICEHHSSSHYDYWSGDCDYESWIEIVGVLDLSSGQWSRHNAPGVSKNPADRNFVMRLGS